MKTQSREIRKVTAAAFVRLLLLALAVPAFATPKAMLVHPDEFTDRWIERASTLGIDVLSFHPVGGSHAHESLAALLKECGTPEFRARVDRAFARGLRVEYEFHAGSWLLPRELFKEHPEYFRVGRDGKRTPDLNFCPSNEEALKLAGERARKLAKALYRPGHRFYFWLDDADDSACHCEKCRALTPSDQSLTVLNRLVAELRRDDPEAQLAYLAYLGTIKPPKTVKPAEGIFLEYAPIGRRWDLPVTAQDAVKAADVNALLDFFGRKGSRVLEYWYDNSLFSRWTKPPKKFVPDKPVIEADVAWYEALGFESIASFACYLGPDYEALWGEPDASGFTAAIPKDRDYPIKAADMRKVKVTGGFWYDRLETNRLSTLKSCFAKCNETPRIANFTNAASRCGNFGGIPFDDSDVYKVMEGAAYVLAAHPDGELERYCDWLIGQFAGAQEPDGYLYTARTLDFRAKNPAMRGDWRVGMMGPTRWSNCPSSHELYNNGHMIEAAVAWYRATGKRNFLDVAVKAADLIERTFGPAPTQLKDCPGHEEIELALVKLYRVTKEDKYLRLARHFLDVRGRRQRRDRGMQTHLPVVRQREAVGHAVRAGYLYCGMADVAALTGSREYADAVSATWENVVGRKLHLHGGIGATPRGEAFDADWVLPNDWKATYDETCAQIANCLWNERLFRSHGETKYVDVLERTLYNGFLSGISIAGDEYFYPNPLACKGGYRRSKWFGCSCCPVNDVRFIPQVPSFAFASKGDAIYWNLFMQCEAEIAGMKVRVDTDYPWKGSVKLTVLQPSTSQPPNLSTSQPPNLSTSKLLKLRIPGWAVGRPVPSDLYSQTVPSDFGEVSVAVNGAALDGCPGEDGYVAIRSEWKAGDVVTVELPMPVKRVKAHPAVKADAGRLAVEKGPVVYCAEGVDNGGKAYDAVLPADATFTETAVTIGDRTYPALRASNGLVLIPYCLWNNREPGNELQTWFRTK